MKTQILKIIFLAAVFAPLSASALWLYPDQLQGKMCAEWVCQMDSNQFAYKSTCDTTFSVGNDRPDPATHAAYSAITRTGGNHCFCLCEFGGPDFGGNIQ